MSRTYEVLSQQKPAATTTEEDEGDDYYIQAGSRLIGNELHGTLLKFKLGVWSYGERSN
jgi:hypothetical protein